MTSKHPNFLILLEEESDMDLLMPHVGSEKLLQAERGPSFLWTVLL